MSELTPEERALLASNSDDTADSDAAHRKAGRRKQKAEDTPTSAPKPTPPPAPAPTTETEPQQKAEDAEPAAESTPKRGPLTPVQFDGDGWNDLPIQMRG
jgi:hypothetical protein